MSKNTSVKVKAVGKDRSKRGSAYMSPSEFDRKAQQMNTRPDVLVQMEDGSFQILAVTDLTRKVGKR